MGKERIKKTKTVSETVGEFHLKFKIMDINIAKIKKSLFIAVISVLFVGFGCESVQNTYYNWEISSGSEPATISEIVDNIAYEFYLLNEKGEKTTLFNEGENIYFNFYITNIRETGACIDRSVGLGGSGLFNVFDLKGVDYGTPLPYMWAITSGYNAFLPDSTYGFSASWRDNREMTLGRPEWDRGVKDFLPKGKYYTEYKHTFDFSCGLNNSGTQNTITLKINFEVQ